MNPEHPSGFALARQVLVWQAAISVVSAAVVFGIYGLPPALAALYGGVVAAAPTIYFALRVFSRSSKDTPASIVGAFYQGEIGKLALTAVLFFIGVALFARYFLPLILTYMACLQAYWVVMATADKG